ALRAEGGSPADRRPLHDGPAGGRPRGRAARRGPRRPVSLRDVPAAPWDAGAASGAGAQGRDRGARARPDGLVVRERWFGATGRRVPEIVVEGDPAVPIDEALVLDDVSDPSLLHEAHVRGTPIVVRAADAESLQRALARPEVASVLVPPEAADLLELDLTSLTYGKPVSTYSIVACDLESGQWGVAVQSKFLAVGAVVPSAEPRVGAIATQSYANPRYGPDGLAHLREGRSAQEVVDALVAADEGRAKRQVGIVDGQGGSATYTGGECMDWAGGRIGPCYAAQGNILVSQATVDALADTFEATAGKPFAERL